MDTVTEAFGEEAVSRCLTASMWITLSGRYITDLDHDELLVIIAYQSELLKEGNRKAKEEWIPALQLISNILCQNKY